MAGTSVDTVATSQAGYEAIYGPGLPSDYPGFKFSSYGGRSTRETTSGYRTTLATNSGARSSAFVRAPQLQELQVDGNDPILSVNDMYGPRPVHIMKPVNVDGVQPKPSRSTTTQVMPPLTKKPTSGEVSAASGSQAATAAAAAAAGGAAAGGAAVAASNGDDKEDSAAHKDGDAAGKNGDDAAGEDGMRDGNSAASPGDDDASAVDKEKEDEASAAAADKKEEEEAAKQKEEEEAAAAAAKTEEAEAAGKKEDEDAADKRKEEEEAAAKKAEEDAAAKKKAEEEAAAKKAEEEAAAKKKAEEDAAAAGPTREDLIAERKKQLQDDATTKWQAMRPVFGATIEDETGHDRIEIVRCVPGKAAHHAGVKEKDLCTHVAGVGISGNAEFKRETGKFKPGDKVIYTFHTRGKPKAKYDLEVMIGGTGVTMDELVEVLRLKDGKFKDEDFADIK